MSSYRQRSPVPIYTTEQSITRQSTMVAYSPTPRNVCPISVLPPNSPSSGGNAEYCRLLDSVLLAARRAMFPSCGSFNMSVLNDSLPGAEGYHEINSFDAFRSDSQLERDLKVGAAGELFVFELLSRLSPSLTGWGEWNWQSSIRRYVTLHPDYADMAPWYGRETADMTYDDMAGEFTALLIDREYLGAEEWADERPKYFIEVKATTGPLDQPFFMSKHQYQRMRAIHNRNDFPEVYLIFRVFDICGGNLGMKVYLDPEQLRLDEGLVFTEQSWSVVPGQ